MVTTVPPYTGEEGKREMSGRNLLKTVTERKNLIFQCCSHRRRGENTCTFHTGEIV